MVKVLFNNIVAFIYLLLLNLNYFYIKANGYYLYLGDWFDYKFDLLSFAISMIVGMIIFNLYFHYAKTVIGGLLSALICLGVIPSVVVFSFSTNEVSCSFFISYVIFVVLLLVSCNRPGNNTADNVVIYKPNTKLMAVIAVIGALLLLYFAFSNYSYLVFSGIDSIYEQRSISKTLISGFKNYLYVFMKYAAGYSLVFLAFYYKKAYFLMMFGLIFTFDYMLGAHKFSLLVMLVVVVFYISYFYIGFLRRNYHLMFFYCSFSFLVLISALLHFSSSAIKGYVVAIYDRLFFVTSGIFARNYDYVSKNDYFYGGSSKVGLLFSADPVDVYYVIGEYYWSRGVMANTDIISDAFVNFGLYGVAITLLVFRLLVTKKDDKFFMRYHGAFYPIAALFSISAIFSLGFSISLLTGGLIYFFIFLKLRERYA